ncbi:MAG TPA: hypothetical protein VIO84_00050 [Candidatus Dormibacteraeota bacterium]
MPRLPICLAALIALVLACQSQSPPAATPRPSPSAAATPLPQLRPPADAVLADADVGLPRTAGRDHLSAAEAARDTANEVLALETYSGWGWVEASTRTWSGGGRQAAETLLLTLRAEGASRAFDAWAADAARAPYAAVDCPASVSRLDQCRLGVAGDRALVVGRLGAEVFRIETTGVDSAALASKQASRMVAPG